MVLKRTLLVAGVLVTNIQDLGIIKDLMVEAKDLLILDIHGWRHYVERESDKAGFASLTLAKTQSLCWACGWGTV